MTTVILSVVIVTIIGIIAGVGLSVASVIMKVPVDEKAQQIREALPGANCGACGFSGCDGYAKALSEGKTDKPNLCAPGGQAAADKIAEIMGVSGGVAEKRVAKVKCLGTCDKTQKQVNYKGIRNCRAAKQILAGGGACSFGCIGYGDCAAVCPENAIEISNGIACVSDEKCVGCGLCAKECPNSVIEVRALAKPTVSCKNTDKGAEARKVCEAGCIGCGLCAKKCPEGAITVENFLAYIDNDKCINCGLCKESCPRKCII